MKLARGFVMVEGLGDSSMTLLGGSARLGMVFAMAEALGG